MEKKKIWMSGPSRKKTNKVPDSIKHKVEEKASVLVQSVLKPLYVKAPPENAVFNYIIDINSRWYRSYYYFIAIYRCPSPNALSDSFESKFARLEYAGNERFNLSFMRYTGQWIEILMAEPLDECLESIKNDPFFVP